MLDPMVSLAFTVYSNKGAYALLLGSGISRASGIPTGWEVILDLIRKVAALEEENCEPDPAAWFEQKYKAKPDYSKLLDAIAKTPSERQQLLRQYFEPNEEERSRGLKAPSLAHKAIAKLVAGGYLRVIITTNFDRLTEKALEDEGLTPTIISTSDQISGALPLAHSGITIIKLHGDYLDTRIRNTEAELASYDAALNKTLDQVLDEYGLIICGWSAEWDLALRAAIERCPSRRFTTFWAARSALSGQAKRLLEHRKAETVLIQGADQLFVKLQEKVEALNDLAAPHPLSSKMAVATLKRYLVDPSAKIRLHELIHEEVEKFFLKIDGDEFSGGTSHPIGEEINRRIEKYHTLAEPLLPLLITGCFWGNREHIKLWTNCLQRVVSLKNLQGSTHLLNLRSYPALVFLYGTGIASVAAENYHTLSALLTIPKAKDDHGREQPICSVIYPGSVFDGTGKLLPGMERHHTPVSDYFFNVLRTAFKEYLPRDEDYEAAFDRFEYFLGLIHADLNSRDEDSLVKGWGPVGRFSWKRLHPVESHIFKKVDAELEVEKANWPPLMAGLFGRSLDRARETKVNFDTFWGKFNWR